MLGFLQIGSPALSLNRTPEFGLVILLNLAAIHLYTHVVSSVAILDAVENIYRR